MGYWEYEPIAEKYRVPIVVTGFEPLDMLQGIYMTVQPLEAGPHEVENQYARVRDARGQPRRAAPDRQGIRGRATAPGAASARSH